MPYVSTPSAGASTGGAPAEAPARVLERVPGSRAYMERARRVIARGVASGARLRSVPVVFERAQDAHLWDVDGNRYVDCVMALGPLLLGHSPSFVLERVAEQLARGIQYGGQHAGEAELAERVVRLVPCADKVVFASTGSEAVQAAVRIARATTGRRVVVKFEGHYHGWIDPLFVNAPGVPAQPVDGPLVSPVHNVAGQPPSQDVLVCRWNDAAALEAVLQEARGEVAAVIMEPIPFNLGTFWPEDGYVRAVRELCDLHGSLLIFDEVVSGFRLGTGGAQERLGVSPDLATYAKGIASGFPIGLVAGTDAAMASAVDGPVVPAGTYNGTPASVAAANATLDMLERRAGEIYPHLEAVGRRLADGLRELAAGAGAPLAVNQIGSVVQLLWQPRTPQRSYADADAASTAPVAALCERVLADGVHAAPRGLMFLSAAHDDADIDLVLRAFERALRGSPAATGGVSRAAPAT
jgi:glutamate-1-semialdehyde 2,1-aminomutase